MYGISGFEALYIITAFLVQVMLIVHFAVRRVRFDITMRHGWIVYALSVPAAGVSIVLLSGGQHWSLWLGGFIYLIWALFGYTVEYVKKIEWRNSLYWPIFGPYVFLYLATLMFYWWPAGLISRPLWYVFAVLSGIGTVLNITSHKIRTNI